MARFLIDICHPAHCHFFRYPIEMLASAGHEVVVTSREKEMSGALLDGLGVTHRQLDVPSHKSTPGMLRELALRDIRLAKTAREFRPDVISAVGGIFAAHAAILARTQSVIFYDTENARLQNLLTYPFATQVIVPHCYRGWLPSNAIRYHGYHELSYLHPNRFSPDRRIALENGLAPDADTFLVRIVAWTANHDIGQTGWSPDLLREIVYHLTLHGHVVISSEIDLPEDLRNYQYRGAVTDIHHLMAYCRAYVGESATMASECAVLGVPAIYAAPGFRGYTSEQEEQYRLVLNVPNPDFPSLRSAIDSILTCDGTYFQQQRTRLLNESVDVARMVFDSLERQAGQLRNSTS